jgi:aminopeptidase-like protein
MKERDSGAEMHSWATDLFPICRSLTGQGVRETLDYLSGLMSGMKIVNVPSGTKVLDWTVPQEWLIRDAYVADSDGRRLIDFQKSNLHVVGYSEPVDMMVTREELDAHLHSLPDQPSAIPYVTSYYRRTWGFCLADEERINLGSGPFHVVVDSELFDGNLTYGEVVIPGESEDEVLLSTYVCHPSMANNELSGPVVAAALVRWLTSLDRRRYTYRVVFIPETIGSIAYLANHLDHLRARTVAGWVLTCIGDERAYSYLPSRHGQTLADRVSLKALDERGHEYRRYSYLERGSDERQWCSPGADLPVASLMRSKYGEFPEYHTSLDDLTLVTASGLEGGLGMMIDVLTLLEANKTWRAVHVGEPQLGPRGLYPNTSIKGSGMAVRDMVNVLAYADGTLDVIGLSEACEAPTSEIVKHATKLAEAGLLVATD